LRVMTPRVTIPGHQTQGGSFLAADGSMDYIRDLLSLI